MPDPEPSLLSLNLSTLLLQIANFLILALVLTRFLFKPLKEMLDKRERQATQAMDDATEAAQQAESLRKDYELKRESIDAEFAALKNEARIVIENTRQQMLQEAYAEIESMRAQAKEEIEQQRAEALRLHRNKIGELVASLVERMMRDVATPQIHQSYLDIFLAQLRAVELAERVPAGEEAISAELITAAPLPEPYEPQIAGTLEAALSQPVALSVRVDPGLITGAMIRLGDVLIDGSLQGQIQRLRSQYEEDIG